MAKRDPRNGCDFCKSPSDCTGETSEPGQHYICTRERGHEGDHVACGTMNHQLKRWPNRSDAPLLDGAGRG